MKKLLLYGIIAACGLCLCACRNNTPETTQSAASSTTQKETAAKTISENVDYDPPLMFMENDTMYYDTGAICKEKHTCGTMDGNISSSVEHNKRPTQNGQSNFGSSYGYQMGSKDNTLEVQIDGEWHIFSPNIQNPYVVSTYEPSDTNGITTTYYRLNDGTYKIEGKPYVYEYRLVLTGRDPNAVKDSTFVVLSNIEDITHQTVLWSLISSNSKDWLNEQETVIVEIR